jgi:hypothetical protein
VPHHLDVPRARLVVEVRAAEQLDVVADALERVVDLVGDARGQEAERREPLAHGQLVLDRALVRAVAQRDLDDAPVGELDRRETGFAHEHAAAGRAHAHFRQRSHRAGSAAASDSAVRSAADSALDSCSGERRGTAEAELLARASVDLEHGPVEGSSTSTMSAAPSSSARYLADSVSMAFR